MSGHEGVIKYQKTYLDDKGAKVAQDVVDIFGIPDTRSGHCLYQVGPSQEGDSCGLLAVGSIDAPSDLVDLVVEMVEDFCGFQIFVVKSLPRIDCVTS